MRLSSFFLCGAACDVITAFMAPLLSSAQCVYAALEKGV